MLWRNCAGKHVLMLAHLSTCLSRSPVQPEDVYLQCDLSDDAIYSNDMSCSLAILPPDTEEEDIYIMPDVL